MSEKRRKGAGKDKPLVSGRTLARMIKPARRRGTGGPMWKQARRPPPKRSLGASAAVWGPGFTPGGGWTLLPLSTTVAEVSD